MFLSSDGKLIFLVIKGNDELLKLYAEKVKLPK